MHELSVTKSILKIVSEAAQGSRVLLIRLRIGDLVSIVDDSVEFYFELLSRGTSAAGARLEFNRVPATASCRDCHSSFEVRLPLPEACPYCRSLHMTISGGTEFLVESIEVEDGDTHNQRDPEG